jgi:hypothetical protein
MASSQSRIAELATTVAHHTQRVDNYLAERGLPCPSFEVDGPVDLALPPEIEESRTVVLQASQELNDLLQGPRNLIFNHQVRINLDPLFINWVANVQNSTTSWCI